MTIEPQEERRGDQGWSAPEAAAVLLLTALAGWLRWRLLDQPIRYDEAVTWLRYVSEPLTTGLSLYDLPNNHVFHTLLAHLSTGLLGDGPRALRLPAFVAGTAVVPATWWLGRGTSGIGAALVASTAVAVSPVLVLFSTNARGYGLVVLAFVVLARLAADLRRRRSPGRLAAFAAVTALAGWTMPAALYPAAAAGAWLAAPAAPGEGARPLDERLRAVGAVGVTSAAAVACLYAPVLSRSGLESLVANRFVAPRGPLEAARGLPGFLGEVATQWVHGVPAAVAGILVFGAVAAGASEIRRRRTRGVGKEGAGGPPPPLFPVALAASAAVLVAHGRVPFARVWLFLLPAFAIFAGRGLAAVADRAAAAVGEGGPRSARAAVLGGALLAVAAAGTTGLIADDPVRRWGLTGTLPAGDRVARYLADRLEPGDAVRAPLPSDAPLEYYFRRLDVRPGVVNASPEPDGCVYLVVNRRREETPAGVAPAGPAGARPRLLRRFGATEVYAAPPAAVPGAGDGCRPAEAGAPPPTGTTERRRGGRPGESAPRRIPPSPRP